MFFLVNLLHLNAKRLVNGLCLIMALFGCAKSESFFEMEPEENHGPNVFCGVNFKISENLEINTNNLENLVIQKYLEYEAARNSSILNLKSLIKTATAKLEDPNTSEIQKELNKKLIYATDSRIKETNTKFENFEKQIKIFYVYLLIILGEKDIIIQDNSYLKDLYELLIINCIKNNNNDDARSIFENFSDNFEIFSQEHKDLCIFLRKFSGIKNVEESDSDEKNITMYEKYKFSISTTNENPNYEDINTIISNFHNSILKGIPDFILYSLGLFYLKGVFPLKMENCLPVYYFPRNYFDFFYEEFNNYKGLIPNEKLPLFFFQNIIYFANLLYIFNQHFYIPEDKAHKIILNFLNSILNDFSDFMNTLEVLYTAFPNNIQEIKSKNKMRAILSTCEKSGQPLRDVKMYATKNRILEESDEGSISYIINLILNNTIFANNSGVFINFFLKNNAENSEKWEEYILEILKYIYDITYPEAYKEIMISYDKAGLKFSKEIAKEHIARVHKILPPYDTFSENLSELNKLFKEQCFSFIVRGSNESYFVAFRNSLLSFMPSCFKGETFDLSFIREWKNNNKQYKLIDYTKYKPSIIFINEDFLSPISSNQMTFLVILVLFLQEKYLSREDNEKGDYKLFVFLLELFVKSFCRLIYALHEEKKENFIHKYVLGFFRARYPEIKVIPTVDDTKIETILKKFMSSFSESDMNKIIQIYKDIPKKTKKKRKKTNYLTYSITNESRSINFSLDDESCEGIYDFYSNFFKNFEETKKQAELPKPKKNLIPPSNYDFKKEHPALEPSEKELESISKKKIFLKNMTQREVEKTFRSLSFDKKNATGGGSGLNFEPTEGNTIFFHRMHAGRGTKSLGKGTARALNEALKPLEKTTTILQYGNQGSKSKEKPSREEERINKYLNF